MFGSQEIDSSHGHNSVEAASGGMADGKAVTPLLVGGLVAIGTGAFNGGGMTRAGGRCLFMGKHAFELQCAVLQQVSTMELTLVLSIAQEGPR